MLKEQDIALSIIRKSDDKDFLIYPGKLTVADTFRIGCIGNLDDQDMRDTLEAIKEVVKVLNVNLKKVGTYE